MAALPQAAQEVGAAFHKVAQASAPTGLLGKAKELALSAGTGIIRSGFETYDAIFGHSSYSDQTDFRHKIDLQAAILGDHSAANAMTEGVTRFATVFIGLLLLLRVARIFCITIWSRLNQNAAQVDGGIRREQRHCLFQAHARRLLLPPLQENLAADSLRPSRNEALSAPVPRLPSDSAGADEPHLGV